ncbi:hypothetical protein BN2497_5465 [Janthinobacterium sp. CG23_2]|nr:hypothetical protein BN2497_5465 [Janthinobacterium sp. CG23_2]CUU29130.1 hypothetical protein BN3177_5465 [Janthinobacterium sp. CG23_2]
MAMGRRWRPVFTKIAQFDSNCQRKRQKHVQYQIKFTKFQ